MCNTSSSRKENSYKHKLTSNGHEIVLEVGMIRPLPDPAVFRRLRFKYHEHALDNIRKTEKRYKKVVVVSTSYVFCEGMAAAVRS